MDVPASPASRAETETSLYVKTKAERPVPIKISVTHPPCSQSASAETGDATIELHGGSAVPVGTPMVSSPSPGDFLANTRYVSVHHMAGTVNPTRSLNRLGCVPAATACSSKQAYRAPVSRPSVRLERDINNLKENAASSAPSSANHDASHSRYSNLHCAYDAVARKSICINYEGNTRVVLPR